MLRRIDNENMVPRDLSNDDESMISFLIERKLGLPIEAMFANLSTAGRQEADLLADQRNELWANYASLPASQLKHLFDREQSILASDVGILFKSLTSIQAKTWVSKDAWTLDEAIILSLGFEPHAEIRNWANKNQTHEFALSFIERDKLVRRAMAASKLSDPIPPSRFLFWADEKFTLPQELEAKVFEIGNSPANLSAQLASAQLKIKELEVKIVSLTADLKLQERPTYKTALVLFAIAAQKIQNFNTEAKRNTATAAIVNAASFKGLQIDAKTVRNYIDKGLEMMGEARKRKKPPC